MKIHSNHLFFKNMLFLTIHKSGYKTTMTYKIELFSTILSIFQLLTFVTKNYILDVAGVFRYAPRLCYIVYHPS